MAKKDYLKYNIII